MEQWHWRVKVFEGNPTKQILTYTEAVRTVDPLKAVGKPHTLWVAFAKLYEKHNDLANALRGLILTKQWIIWLVSGASGLNYEVGYRRAISRSQT